MVDKVLVQISETLAGWGIFLISALILFISFVFGRDWWLWRIRDKYLNNLKWTILEIKVPKENLKSPKAMEQVFAALYATFSFGFKWSDKWLEGKVEDWMSFEMVGFSSSIHFFIYVQQKYRSLVESAFFSHYPGVEIYEAEDYTKRFGEDLPNDDYDLFGTDFILSREDCLPIKTYHFFEEHVEEKRLDPIATIAEVMSGLKSDEMIWLQILIRPTDDTWKNEAEELVGKIMGRAKKAPPRGWKDAIAEFLINLFWSPIQHPSWGKNGDEEKPAGSNVILSPGEQELLEAVNNKTSKPGFETVLRFIYLDKKEAFTADNVYAVMGAINQFRTQNLNSFRPNSGTITTSGAVGMFFRESRLLERKRKLFQSYLAREMPLSPKKPFALNLKASVLCTEELATLYHPPITAVAAPSLEFLSSKKGSPPPNLPIIND